MNISEAINSLDNTEIIKLISITVTVLLALIGLIVRAILVRWKHKLDVKIKVLEAQNLLNTQLLNTFSSASNITQSKRIDAIGKFWIKMIDLRYCIPRSGQLAYLILLPDELDRFFDEDSDLKKGLINDVYRLKGGSKFVELCECCEELRPFLGERLWFDFQILRGFIGRSMHIFEKSVEKKKMIFWMDDDYFKNVFMGFLTDDEKKLINRNRNSSYNYAIEIIEQRLMTEMNDILSGRRLTYDSVEMAEKLTEVKEKE